MPAERGKPDSRGLNFFDITDFSPGIYSNSQIVNPDPAAPTGVFPAPPGAADVTNTYGCIALDNGGLGPGPAVVSGYPKSLNDIGIAGVTAPGADIMCLINTFHTFHDEFVVGLNFDFSAGNQDSEFWSWAASVGTNPIQVQSYNYTGDHNICCYPFATTIGAQPVICLPLAAIDGPNSNLVVYPSVSSPTAFGVDVIETNATATGTAFGHQGRIVVQAFLDGGSWPISSVDFANESFNYTDPPLSETWPAQGELFGPENPFGYGAVNSVSAGELFCVKCRGGADIIQGDLNNPTVTSLPGVKSTGPIYGRTDSDANGLYYCAQYEGAWAWNGGNSSQKISKQLDDNFFTALVGIDSPYYSYYIQRWGDWMLFSSNWIFDSNTGAWWRLEQQGIQTFFWYVPSFNPRFMAAAIGTVETSATPFLWAYDRGTPRNAFSWQSLPIKIPSEDRTSTPRELVIRASNPYADAAPQIIATLIDDKGNTSTLETWTMTSGVNTVQETRLNAALKQTTTVAVQLAVSGTLYAPVVHGLSMGSRTREHVGIGQ